MRISRARADSMSTVIGSTDSGRRECFEAPRRRGFGCSRGWPRRRAGAGHIRAPTRVFEATIGEAFGLAQEPFERATELQAGERGPTEPRALGSAGERAHGAESKVSSAACASASRCSALRPSEAYAGERERGQRVEALALAAKGAQETAAHRAGHVTRVESPAHSGMGERLSMRARAKIRTARGPRRQRLARAQRPPPSVTKNRDRSKRLPHWIS